MFGGGGGTWQAGSGNTWGDDATVGIANFKGWITNLKYRFKPGVRGRGTGVGVDWDAGASCPDRAVASSGSDFNGDGVRQRCRLVARSRLV